MKHSQTSWNHNAAYHPWILARHHGAADWVRSALSVPVNRIAGRLHHEQSDIGVPVAEPAVTYADLRRMVRSELPGAQWRYGLHHRYLLRWTAPPTHRPRLANH